MNPLSVCSCVCIPVAIYIQVFVLLFSPDITTWPYPPYSSIFRYRAKINRINAYACHVRACVCAYVRARAYMRECACLHMRVHVCAPRYIEKPWQRDTPDWWKSLRKTPLEEWVRQTDGQRPSLYYLVRFPPFSQKYPRWLLKKNDPI